jgi:hypothetical protein
VVRSLLHIEALHNIIQPIEENNKTILAGKNEIELFAASFVEFRGFP